MAENQLVCFRKFKFFRVLLYGFSNQLAIPQRLTKHFIEQNLTSVTLLSPLGESWNVRIGGNSAGLHFTEGWGRFAAAHRLSFGDLLVFKYVGGIVFHVTIFDESTCEKDYKITNIGVAGDDHVPGQESECFKGNTTPPSSGQRTPPVMKQESNEDQTQVLVRTEALKLVYKAKKATEQTYKSRSRFEITISAKLKYKVGIPIKFARSNGLLGVRQMLLRDSEGHPWPVNLLHCKYSVSGQDWLLLSAGWRGFCVDNDLKDGDVCVFEFKEKNEMLVQIRRLCEEDGSRRSMNTLQEAVQLRRAATLQQVGFPSKVTTCTSKPAEPAQYCFKSTIVPTNLGKTGNMTIPKAFVSLVDLSAEKGVVLVDPHSRRWPVKIYHDKRCGRCRMGNGDSWEGFCGENNVEVGDVCVFSFHYRGNETATLKVEVIKLKSV